MTRYTRSEEAKAWRKLYDKAAWRGPNGLRLSQLSREPLCRFCLIVGDVAEADTVDHIVAHKGDPDLFFDPENVQSLCELCHTRLKAQVEAHGYHNQCDHTGWPVHPLHPANRTR